MCNWLNAKTVYDEINKELGGVYYSSSQSSEIEDTRQVHRQEKKKKKDKRNEYTGIVRRIINGNNAAAF